MKEEILLDVSSAPEWAGAWRTLPPEGSQGQVNVLVTKTSSNVQDAWRQVPFAAYSQVTKGRIVW